MAKVLVVDDDVVMRDYLRASLEEDGYQVRTAGSGSPVRQASYDAVLSDIERPFSLEKLHSRMRQLGLTQGSGSNAK